MQLPQCKKIKMRINFILLFLVFTTVCNAQSKRDYNWILGYPSGPTDNWSRLLLNFNDKRSVTRLEEGHTRIAFNNASISDEEGNLLFYTNGCTVYDSTFQVMLNGDSINLNSWFDFFCDEHASGLQNTLILPDPAYEFGYYVLHQPLHFFEDPLSFQTIELMYSYVDMNENNGKGSVVIKNQIYADNNIFGTGFFTACLHENGKDWWFIKTKYNSDIKYIYGIDENGIFLKDSIAIGDTINGMISGGGQAKFTSDGSMYVTHSQISGLNIYDFDRATGMLSNHQQFFLQEGLIDLSGVEVSPSGQYCYVSFPFVLYQVDLWAEDIAASSVIIDSLDTTVFDPFLLAFTVSQLGPDCKIYISSGSSVRALHVINNPDGKGKTCDFVQSGLKLEVPHDRNSLPNFPHFRMDEEDICNPTITSIFNIPISTNNSLNLFPNPVADILEIEVDTHEKYQYFILDNQAHTIRSGTFVGDAHALDLSSLQSGLYYMRIMSKNNMSVQKFIKF